MRIDLTISQMQEADDPIYRIIGGMTADEPMFVRLDKGVYGIKCFGGSNFLQDFNQYPEFDGPGGSYGVCDTVEQLLAYYPELSDACQDRSFVVTMTCIKRADQSPDGGWRWHKWGKYIGTFDHQYEYLYDEVGIEQVYVYHIYEVCKTKYDKMNTYQLADIAKNLKPEETVKIWPEKRFELTNSEIRKALIQIIENAVN
jgi:hypothetical protein